MKNKSLVLGLALCAINSFAQEQPVETTELETIIIQENRLEIPVEESTRNIQVITKEEIQNMPATSINEVLAYVVGVDVRQRGPFGTQMDVSIDGGSFEQTMILWNGIKVGDAQTAHHSMNLPIPLDAIERIEVLKGPAARIYGINALTGAINIVTKAKPENAVNLKVYAGSSFEDKDAREGNGMYWGGGTQATANIQTGKVNHLAAFQIEKYNGQRYNTQAKNSKTFYQGNYELSNRDELNWLVGYIDNDFGANGFYAPPYDEESVEKVKTLIGSVGATIALSENFTIKPRLSNRYNEDDYIFKKFDPSYYRNKHYSNAFMTEVNAAYVTTIGIFGFGLENRQEEIHSSNLGKHNRSNTGVYAEYKHQYNRLTWNIGAYMNQNTDYGFRIYPGIDLAYQLSDHWRGKFSAGTSQRIPSFTDLYYLSKTNIGNKDLKPEAAWQFEVGVDYRKDNDAFKASAFRRTIYDFIDWVKSKADDPFQPHNLGEQLVNGIQVSWEQKYHFADNQSFKYKLGYQFLSPITQQDNQVISRYVLESLKHQAVLGLQYTYNNLGLHLENRYIKRELNDAYFVMDAKANYKINRHFSLNLQATNLLNTEYKEIMAINLPKRWVLMGLNFHL